MIIITSLMVFNGYFFISKQYELLEAQMDDTKRTFVNNKRALLKREVDSVMSFIDFKRQRAHALHETIDEEALKKELYD